MVALTPAGPAWAPPAPSAGGRGPEPVALAVLRGLGRRWRSVVGFGLLAAAVVGGAVWLMLPSPQPSATAKLLVYQGKAPTVLAADHPDQPLDRQTQIALVKSQLVLNAALNMNGVANLPVVKEQPEPLDWLAKKLAVDFEGPEILRITLAADDPEQAKVLVNAVLDAFFKEVVNQSLVIRETKLRQLGDLALTAEETLKRKRTNFRDVAQGLGGADEKSLAHQQFFARQQLIAAQADLLKIQSDLRRLKPEEAALNERIVGSVVDLPDAVLEQYVDDDERVRAAELKRKQLEAKVDAYRKAASDINNTSAGRQLLLDLEDHKRDQDRLRGQVRTEVKERARLSSKAELTARLATVRQQIKFQEGLAQSLTADVKRFDDEVNEMRKATLDLDPQRLEVRQAEDLLTKIRAAETALKLERDTPPRVRELERAVVTRVDPERRRLMMSGGGALAALAAVLALVGFTEFRLRRVDSADAVTAGLGLRVVGTVPKRPLRWAPWAAGADDFERWAAESISSTRTMLMHAGGLSAHRVIQVTSPVSGEGKTTLSCQLAASVAATGRRTLLVDADLRNPSAHLQFNVPVGPGLCEVLRGEVSVHDVVRETPVAGLMMIPAGQWKDETAVALVSTELQGLFEVWRSQFDFVIVDSSPVLPVTDPLLLALHADGVLVSLLQGVSRMPLANEAYKRMTALGIRVLGVVLNGTPVRGYGYSTGYFPKA